jgi:alkylation response protein AidB-like acyl-CoA dehydrogenase
MVAAMAIGAGEAALEIAISYAKERVQFGAPLSEKQGYTHKLIVPHVVRLAAARAYMDEIAVRLDAGESDLQVEGSLAKFFASEVANRAADDAMQALGGYGYIGEYEVEKIKRDVKITCIYEGTSEIQQNIISTFRWKVSRKTKGAFYGKMDEEMAALHREAPTVGARFYGLAARTLGALVDRVHEKKLTRRQSAMFSLADTMALVEVGVALGRKAGRRLAEGDPEGEKFAAMSRIFANEVAERTVQNSLRILSGSGEFDDDALGGFMEETGCDELTLSYRNLLGDMDAVADHIFERNG